MPTAAQAVGLIPVGGREFLESKLLITMSTGLNSDLQLGHWPACMKAGLQVHVYLLVAAWSGIVSRMDICK